MKRIRRAPAKVNLFLFMAGRRQDGYHLLYSCMQTISLYDEVEVEITEGKGRVTLDSDQVKLLRFPEKNTCVMAAKALLSELPSPDLDVTIRLTKRIPSQAGLGGGSSDAAAVLLAMNEMLPAPVSDEKLHAIALRVGADVPFFLDGGTSLCEGVGEVITKLPPLVGLPMLIMKPAKGVSTPGCYARFDQKGRFWSLQDDQKPIMEDFLSARGAEDALTRVKKGSGVWGNDLEEPALSDAPEIGIAPPLMREYGAVYAAMSGSGSAVFGIFEREEQVDDLIASDKIRKLREQGWFVQKVFSI